MPHNFTWKPSHNPIQRRFISATSLNWGVRRNDTAAGCERKSFQCTDSHKLPASLHNTLAKTFDGRLITKFPRFNETSHPNPGGYPVFRIHSTPAICERARF